MELQTPKINTSIAPHKNWFMRHGFLYSAIGALSIVVLVASSALWWTRVQTSKNLSIGQTPVHKSQAHSSMSASGWKIYTNIQYKFEIQYPPTWVVSNLSPTSFTFKDPQPVEKGTCGVTLSFGGTISPHSDKNNYYNDVSQGEVCDKALNQILATYKIIDPSKYLDSVSPTDTSTWKTYTNSQYGFSFKYPKDWTPDTLNEQSDFIAINDPETMAAKKKNPALEYPGDLVVQIDQNPKKLNAKDYYNGKDGFLAFDNPSEDREITVDGQTAYHIYPLTGIAPGENVIVPKGTIFIDFSTFIGDKNEEGIYNQIVSTFKFTK